MMYRRAEHHLLWGGGSDVGERVMFRAEAEQRPLGRTGLYSSVLVSECNQL